MVLLYLPILSNLTGQNDLAELIGDMYHVVEVDVLPTTRTSCVCLVIFYTASVKWPYNTAQR